MVWITATYSIALFVVGFLGYVVVGHLWCMGFWQVLLECVVFSFIQKKKRKANYKEKKRKG
jgi:hypothetical protein